LFDVRIIKHHARECIPKQKRRKKASFGSVHVVLIDVRCREYWLRLEQEGKGRKVGGSRYFEKREKLIKVSFPLLLSVTLGGTLGLGGLLLSQTLLLSGLLGGKGLGAVVLRHGLENGLLLLGLDDGDRVGEGLLGAGLALGVGTTHDLDLDTEDTLAEENVASGRVDELLGGLTGVDHETVLGEVSWLSQLGRVKVEG
jgi:hypothetical protein